jgi:hypothetical protein
MESNPVRIMVIPKPLSPSGTLEYFSLNLMADIITIAIANPMPELIPKTVDSAKL